MDDPINDLINEYKKLQSDHRKVVEQLVNDKNDVSDEDKKKIEDALNSAGSIIFTQISENIISILSSPSIVKSFNDLRNSGLDDKCIKELINLIAIITTNASYQNIIFYDELLKNELTKQFNNIITSVNTISGDVEGIKGSIKVFKKKIDDIKNDNMLNDIKNK